MPRYLFALVLFMLTAASANAAFLSRQSGQAYYDTVLNITWLADANYAQTSLYDGDGRMDWPGAQAWIASLNAANHLGASAWRLPTTVQPDPSCAGQFDPGFPYPIQGFSVGCTGSEMGHLFNLGGVTSATPSPFANVKPDLYWSDTTVSWSTARAWAFDFNTGGQNTLFKSSFSVYAWAVLDGDALAVVPVPAAVWLLGSALAGLGILRRRAIA